MKLHHMKCTKMQINGSAYFPYQNEKPECKCRKFASLKPDTAQNKKLSVKDFFIKLLSKSTAKKFKKS